MPDIPAKDITDKAKRYSTINYTLVIVELIILLAFLFFILGSGLSRRVSGFAGSVFSNNYLSALAYFFIFFAIYYFISFPLSFYHSFLLDRRYGLSRQKLSTWAADQLKSSVLSFVISAVCLMAFYFVLGASPDRWWITISCFWILFNVVMAGLAPLVIIPLFFKYKKLDDDPLKNRVMNLAGKMKVNILDVFEIDFSKKTLKANAAFVGIGRTRRVLLADTLKDKYTPEEIEIILAHEFAHYRLKHLIKLVLINAAATVACFYLIYKTSGFFLNFYGLRSLSDISAQPLIFIYFIFFGVFTQPLGNYISRVFENEADALAIKTTGNTAAFISTMEKFAEQNLSDRDPHPLIKFIFFSHPSINERISSARRPVENVKQ